MATLEESANAKRDLLEETISVVCGDRNNAYGPPSQDFRRVAEMASTLWGHKLSAPLEAHDVATFMVLLKLSRLAWSPERKDSWVDIAGYAACGWQCVVDGQVEEAEIASSILAHVDACPGCAECEDPHCIAGPENCHGCVLQQQQWERNRAAKGSLMSAD